MMRQAYQKLLQKQQGKPGEKTGGKEAGDKMEEAIEMMKKLGTKKSAAKTHFYPLAMVNIVQ